jgi:hypothetical protein
MLQLDEFFILKADIEQNRNPLEEHLQKMNQYFDDGGNGETWISHKEKALHAKWTTIQV